MPPKTETPSFHAFCSPRYSEDSGVYETKTRSSLGKWPRVADPPAWHPWLEHSTLDASNSTTAPSITMPIFPWRRGSATEASYSRVPDDMTMADRLSDEEAAHPASGAGTRISTGSLQRPRPHTEDTTASSSDLSAPRFLQQDGYGKMAERARAAAATPYQALVSESPGSPNSIPRHLCAQV
ncbi:hypothetical protein V495_04134 [Pseudogymnoascus sp. VKM F-4514 (FW-929)]|nr:hypothetical protein V495_04134 [Pseudogymnoascus sp. VKM F-4514 (FW-929)]